MNIKTSIWKHFRKNGVDMKRMLTHKSVVHMFQLKIIPLEWSLKADLLALTNQT